MFIGHLPAGYLLTRKLERVLCVTGWLWLGLLASVLPDFDLLWFYLVDHRRTLHHHYWIHRPFYWLIISSIWFSLSAARRSPRLRIAGFIVLPNILLHLLLDTIVGKIDWLFPWSGRGYSLFEVKATHHDWYITNYLVHWTFCFEVFVVVWAAVVLAQRWRVRANSSYR